MKNKKIITLTTSILLLFIFGNFLLPITRAIETYTEEIEDFSCVDDTYFNSDMPWRGYGSSPLLNVGYDDYGNYIALFKFDLSNRPENYIKAKVILNFHDYPGYTNNIPFLIHNNSWDETYTYEELDFGEPGEPWEPTILPYSINYGECVMGYGFSLVSYFIDIIEYSDQELLSFGLIMLPYSPVLLQEVSTIYSKEYVVESVRPKIIWTVEHEIVKSQNNEILFLIIGLSVGLIVGSVAVGVFIVLNKRKSKI